MKEDIKISDRKKELLFNAVESYIENASPITSEKVHKTLFNNLSSATLRNELNTLEQMGYLKQLHTSSGRVPTTKAYRFYVNQLLSNNNFDEQVINHIKDNVVVRSTFLSDVLTDIAKEELEENYKQVVIYRVLYGGMDYLNIIWELTVEEYQFKFGILFSLVKITLN